MAVHCSVFILCDKLRGEQGSEGIAQLGKLSILVGLSRVQIPTSGSLGIPEVFGSFFQGPGNFPGSGSWVFFQIPFPGMHRIRENEGPNPELADILQLCPEPDSTQVYGASPHVSSFR